MILLLRSCTRASTKTTKAPRATGLPGGTVLDDHDEPVVHTQRDIATHLETWDPPRVWANIESRRLIVDLSEAAAAGSPEKDALRDAVSAVAMAYQDHPDFDPDWLLREW
ncbi:hypothetical protein AS594_36270 [Streptomyces agglomeratus]|uniref:Uncharacterized protein n=1 Tax=Streptomyces agglomeratus TaxID=285458 RepID=A0A1E5PHQ2_9ACTN|nr:DUF6221 family protein [Streptomyces agglomeratus]OEJ29057.1 hypothetical protein AS594_36270 [Streptomyces agglomeratus]